MRFREDLIKSFLKQNGRQINEDRCYMSGTGNYIYECYTGNGEKWIFQDWHKCTRYINFKKTQNSERFNNEWQKIAIESTTGFQQDSIIEAIRTDGRNKLNFDLDYLCYWNLNNGERRDESISTYGETRLESLLQVERLKCEYDLKSTRTKRDFEILLEGLMNVRAHYNSAIQEKIIEFYDHNVQYGRSLSGEVVAMPNEQQEKILARMNEIKERFDELFKERIYIADKKELEVFGERE